MKPYHDPAVFLGGAGAASSPLPSAAPPPPGGDAGGERRTKPRLAVKPGTFAILRTATAAPPPIQDLGMGDIAFAMYRLRPLHMGQIHDISLGGLSFSYVESGATVNDPLVLDILSAEIGFHLAGLPYRTVWDRGLADDIDVDYVPLRQAGLAFQVPLGEPRRQLEAFMRHHICH